LDTFVSKFTLILLIFVIYAVFTSNEDTIVALATPPGEGAVSLIRISGGRSFEIIDKVFIGGKKISDCAPGTFHYGKIFNVAGEILDDVIVLKFKSPNSYTGEDSIEISTHGSQFIAKKIIEEILLNDARIAEPGEFTKRAFLNNKLDLAQAEAVADIISSRTDASLRGARNQLDGLLSKQVETFREMLITVSSMIELELDFAEEDLTFMPLSDVDVKLKSIVEEIDKLLATYSFGRVIRDGVNVAIVGKPNVGKSSLLNYILKESRAIVSEIPGTTRDVIREEVSIDGLLFRLFDTAGIRLTEDSIEIEGVLRSREAVKNADIILMVNDLLEGFSQELYNEIIDLNGGERVLVIANKSDLSIEQMNNADAAISAKTGEGIGYLFALIKDKALGQANFSENTAVVSNIRHYNALKKAKNCLLDARKSIGSNISGEFISVDIRNAELALGEIIGKVTTDDILNNIFSKFCIGK